MLADLLEETATQLIARVARAVSATTTEVVARRTIARLPELMRGLIEQLRATQPDQTAQLTGLRIQFDVAPLVTAVRLLRDSVCALIDERQLVVTAREMRRVVEWFATVAESALLAENHRFAEMLDAIPDHLLLQNAERFVIYLNRATAEGAGLSRHEVLGRRTVDIVPDKKFGEYVDGCLKRAAAGESITEEFIYPGLNGGRWHEQHMRPVYGPDGRVEAMATSSRDIHARKKAEVRLQLLSKLGALAETMEHERIIDAIANLSIPELADWCLVNVLEDGQFLRSKLAHRDPQKAALADELLQLPSELHRLRVGQAALVGNSTLIVDIGQTIEHSELIDPRSCVASTCARRSSCPSSRWAAPWPSRRS